LDWLKDWKTPNTVTQCHILEDLNPHMLYLLQNSTVPLTMHYTLTVEHLPQ